MTDYPKTPVFGVLALDRKKRREPVIERFDTASAAITRAAALKDEFKASGTRDPVVSIINAPTPSDLDEMIAEAMSRYGFDV